jgi:hypothetical protein
MESKWLELASVAADWLQLFVALATGVATAVWAVWKLTNERRKANRHPNWRMSRS